MLVSLLKEGIISFNNAEYVTVAGITLEGTRGTAVRMSGGTHNTLAGCTIRNTGNLGVVIERGTYNGVQSCDICDTGDGAIEINGGDRKSLIPGYNYADNNHMYLFGRINYTYRFAIRMNGVGCRASHNYIHNARHSAIYFSGNDHIIEYNIIHDVIKETGDARAVYSGRNYSWRNNTVRYNYFYDITGPGLFGSMGVYFDDSLSGNTIFGNVFYNSGRAAFIGGGRDNLIENNIFVDNEASIHIDARGTTWAAPWVTGKDSEAKKKLLEVNYTEPPYSERYPELLKLFDDDLAVPKYNKVLRNVSYGGKWFDIEDGVDATIMTIKGNVIANDTLCYWRGPEVKDAPTGTTYLRGDEAFEKKLEGYVIMGSDPGFVDAAKNDCRLKDDSPALKEGFKPLPFEKMGLFIDM